MLKLKNKVKIIVSKLLYLFIFHLIKKKHRNAIGGILIPGSNAEFTYTSTLSHYNEHQFRKHCF